VSDVCGEKLSEEFVAPLLEEASSRFGFGSFVMLAPEWAPVPHYALFVEDEAPDRVAEYVERGLRTSVHYDYCRQLGQLGPVSGVRVVGGAERYLRGCEMLGQRAGAAKLTYLRRETDWRERLAHGG
jgi:hypothetical protein